MAYKKIEINIENLNEISTSTKDGKYASYIDDLEHYNDLLDDILDTQSGNSIIELKNSIYNINDAIRGLRNNSEDLGNNVSDYVEKMNNVLEAQDISINITSDLDIEKLRINIENFDIDSLAEYPLDSFGFINSLFLNDDDEIRLSRLEAVLNEIENDFLDIKNNLPTYLESVENELKVIENWLDEDYGFFSAHGSTIASIILESTITLVVAAAILVLAPVSIGVTIGGAIIVGGVALAFTFGSVNAYRDGNNIYESYKIGLDDASFQLALELMTFGFAPSGSGRFVSESVEYAFKSSSNVAIDTTTDVIAKETKSYLAGQAWSGVEEVIFDELNIPEPVRKFWEILKAMKNGKSSTNNSLEGI